MPNGSESRGGLTSAPICGAKWNVSEGADISGGDAEVVVAGASVGSVAGTVSADGEGGASGPAGEISTAGLECWNN